MSTGIALPFHDLGARWGWVSQQPTPAALPPPPEIPVTHCTAGWVGPRAGLDVCRKSRPSPGFNPRTVEPVASRYTSWAIAAHNCFVIYPRILTTKTRVWHKSLLHDTSCNTKIHLNLIFTYMRVLFCKLWTSTENLIPKLRKFPPPLILNSQHLQRPENLGQIPRKGRNISLF